MPHLSLVTSVLQMKLTKQASVVPPAPDQVTGHLQGEALRDILALGLLSGVAGVGARVYSGSDYLFGKAKAPSVSRSILPTPVYVPRPEFATEEQKLKALARLEGAEGAVPQRKPRRKFAEDEGDTKTAADEGGVGNYLTNLFSGNKATDIGGIPWYVPGLMLAGAGGSLGGYALADNYLDKKRKTDLNDEVEAAKKEYHDALLANYDPRTVPVRQKTAAEEVGELIDRLAEAYGITDDTPLEKAAFGGNTMGKMLGLYGAFAVPAALLSGVAAYRYGKDRSDKELIEKALKQRERDRLNRMPLDVYAEPSPVTINSDGLVVPR